MRERLLMPLRLLAGPHGLPPFHRVHSLYKEFKHFTLLLANGELRVEMKGVREAPGLTSG